MAAKTLHVYRSDEGWAVKKEGKPAKTFGTKREAFQTAVRGVKNATAAQIVVHGKDGRITEHRTYGMPTVQNHPKESSLRAKRIARAVAKVVLDRLTSGPLPHRAHAPAK
jgi:hypothetical protein